MKRKNPPQLNTEDAINLQGTIEAEGFDYAFRFYSSFKEIKDKKFHSLRKAYIKAAQNLSDYCRVEEDFEEDEKADDPYGDAESCTVCGDLLDEDGTCHTCTEDK
jgi:hypothetical protein